MNGTMKYLQLNYYQKTGLVTRTDEPDCVKTTNVAVAHNNDSGHHGHGSGLIRVIFWRLLESYEPKLSSCEQREIWSNWMNAQSDLSLRKT